MPELDPNTIFSIAALIFLIGFPLFFILFWVARHRAKRLGRELEQETIRFAEEHGTDVRPGLWTQMSGRCAFGISFSCAQLYRPFARSFKRPVRRFLISVSASTRCHVRFGLSSPSSNHDWISISRWTAIKKSWAFVAGDLLP